MNRLSSTIKIYIFIEYIVKFDYIFGSNDSQKLLFFKVILYFQIRQFIFLILIIKFLGFKIIFKCLFWNLLIAIAFFIHY